MRRIIALLTLLGFVTSCQPDKSTPQEWTYNRTIALNGVNPIGITSDGDRIYLSDGDHNRIMILDKTGAPQDSIEGFERPMHIDHGAGMTGGLSVSMSSTTSKNLLYIPEYGTDSIAVLQGTNKYYLSIPDSLDAPGGVSVFEDEIAIADFYNNRVLFYNGEQWLNIGKKGSELGDFNYPTDVQITENNIYVADAYNNRGQIFDKGGNVLGQLGQEENMNAATGIHVTSDEIFLTDFENDRILIFNKELQLKQIIDSNIHKPTDVYLFEGQLWVTNYQKGELVIYKQEAIK